MVTQTVTLDNYFNDFAEIVSDSFDRANSNLSGSKTDSYASGSAGYLWTGASTTPANNNSNVQIISNQVQRTVAEPVNVMFVKSVEHVGATVKIVALPASGDKMSLCLHADGLNAGAIPNNVVRASVFSDGSLELSSTVAGTTTVIATSAAGLVTAGTFLLFYSFNSFVSLYTAPTGPGPYTLASSGSSLVPLTNTFHGLRFSGSTGNAAIFDSLNVFEVGSLVSHEIVPAPGLAATITLGASGVASAESVSSDLVSASITAGPSGVGTSEGFGAHTIYQVLNILTSGLATGEASGGSIVAPGSVALQPGGPDSSETFGAANLFATISAQPSAVASSESLGSPALSMTVSVSPTGQASGESFGNATIQATVSVFPVGTASTEQFGLSNLYSVISSLVSGIVSGQAMGAVVLVPGAVDVSPTGIISREAFSVTTVQPPGFPWFGSEGHAGSLSLVPAYFLELVPNGGFLVILDNWSSVEGVD